jgi:hypothetical protein
LSASIPDCFNPGGKETLDRRLGGPQRGMDVVAKRRSPCLYLELNISHPVALRVMFRKNTLGISSTCRTWSTLLRDHKAPEQELYYCDYNL